MRNLLIFFKLLLIFAVFGQSNDSVKTSKNLPETVKVEQKIQETFKENEAKIEEIRKLKAKNEKDLEYLNVMDKQKKALIKSISKNISILTGINKSTTKTNPPIPKATIKVIEKYYVADSTCTQFNRNFFGVNECVKWDVTYKEIKK